MYTLRLPFELPDEYPITDTEKPIHYGGLEFNLIKKNKFYTLIIKGFSTERDAEKFLSNSWSGFMWVLINCGRAPLWKTEPQKIVNAEDPIATAKSLSKIFNKKIKGEVCALIDSSRPAIFDSGRNYMYITGGSVDVISTSSSERFFEYFFNGIEYKNWEKGFNDKKLSVALDLYAAFFSEATPNARFLALVMVLESLSESVKRPVVVLDLLAKFRDQIEEKEKCFSENSDERASLESLKRELRYREDDSIRQKIKSLVLNTLSKNGDPDALELAKQALKVYDKRSTLVHKGSLTPEELGNISTQARTIAQRVLKAKFLQIVEESHF